MSDLSLVPNEELIVELGSRFTSWIFSGQQAGISAHDNVRTIRRFCADGTHATALGLCVQMMDSINIDFERVSKPAQTDKEEYESI